ncbi:MAG TPA: SRPBCC family protein [Acidimicrobiales bacterium]|nr:SRPBCC family protein [Acidimicrobiales bacterium]
MPVLSPPSTRSASIRLPVEVERAWAVVSDPRTYPRWLVGAVDILHVDDHWPEPGTSFRHRVGLAGPLTTEDSTTVVDLDAPRSLVLKARARPFGRAHVEIEVRPASGGSEVTMREGMLGLLAPLTPLAQPLILARNKRSLQRLRDLPEAGAS